MQIKLFFVIELIYLGMNKLSPLEIHGHRGARGLYPENSLVAFTEALKLGVDAIEMDVVITKDRQVIVSHEAWMNEEFCIDPEANAIEQESKLQHNIYQMNYAQVKQYDCGSRKNPRFVNQQSLPCYKPLLTEVIETTEKFIRSTPAKNIIYNIELKTEPEFGELFNPAPADFVHLVYEVLRPYQLFNRIIFQSFDVRILQELKKTDPGLCLSFLVENNDDLEENLNKLGFLPDIYCPEFILIDEAMLKKLQALNIAIMTWTVNEEKDMKRLIALGVDRLITDYPDIALRLRKKLGLEG